VYAMSPEHIFKLRRKYLHECEKLRKKQVKKSPTLEKILPDEFDPSQIIDKFTIKIFKL